MIVMAPPLSASFITMLVLLDDSLRALCCCLGRLGLTLCGVLEMKLLYFSLVQLTNESIKVFLPLGRIQFVLQRWLCTGGLLTSPFEIKYSCRCRRLKNCSLLWQILTGSANFGVGQKDRPNCRNLWCSGDNLESHWLATLECLVEYAWWFLFVRKTSGTLEKKTGRTFENRVVFTKIVKFIYLVFHEFFALYVAVNVQLSCYLLVGVMC